MRHGEILVGVAHDHRHHRLHHHRLRRHLELERQVARYSFCCLFLVSSFADAVPEWGIVILISVLLEPVLYG